MQERLSRTFPEIVSLSKNLRQGVWTHLISMTGNSSGRGHWLRNQEWELGFSTSLQLDRDMQKIRLMQVGKWKLGGGGWETKTGDPEPGTRKDKVCVILFSRMEWDWRELTYHENQPGRMDWEVSSLFDFWPFLQMDVTLANLLSAGTFHLSQNCW